MTQQRWWRRRGWTAVLVVMVLAVAGHALAARGAPGPDSHLQGLVKTASMVGPLGVSPLMALAGMGVAAQLGVWDAPEGLRGVAHPAWWGTLLLLGVLLHVGRSSKLTKPLAELAGTGESVVAVAVLALALWPQVSAAGGSAVEAGVATALLSIMLYGSTLAVLLVFRTALDFLTWLSPIPLLDFMFQGAKLMLTVGLLALAFFAPWAAAVVNLLLVVLSLVLLSWALRLARFGWVVVHDATWGRWRPKLPLPVDPTMEDDLGPFMVFALEVPGVKKRTPGTLRLDAGRWTLHVRRRWGRVQQIPLGDGERAELRARLLGVELRAAQATVLLPARYRHLTAQIARVSRAQVSEGKAGLLPARALAT